MPGSIREERPDRQQGLGFEGNAKLRHIGAQSRRRSGSRDVRLALPTVAAQLPDTADEHTTTVQFPSGHWTRIWSTSLLEGVDAEIQRPTRVVGIFPNDASAHRLITAVSVEQHDE